MSNKIKVFFATNRTLEADDDGRVQRPRATLDEIQYTGLANGDFRIGIAQVHISMKATVRGKKINDEAKYQTAMLLRGSGTAGFLPNEVIKSLLEESLRSVSNNPTAKRSILAFIPGFNYDFAKSIERGALLAHVYGSEDHAFVPFVFSWPSIGEFGVSEYLQDRKSACESGPSIDRALDMFAKCVTQLKDDSGNSTSVNLVAHSMGGHALLHAIQSRQLKWIGDSQTKLFHRLILAAADVDQDALRLKRKLLLVRKLANQIVVYVNSNDFVLWLAAGLLKESKRLGCHGPQPKTVELFRGSCATLYTIRCSDVHFGWYEQMQFAKQGQFGHQYYRISPFVVSDIQSVLDGKKQCKIDRRKYVGNQVYRLSAPEDNPSSGSRRYRRNPDK